MTNIVEPRAAVRWLENPSPPRWLEEGAKAAAHLSGLGQRRRTCQDSGGGGALVRTRAAVHLSGLGRRRWRTYQDSGGDGRRRTCQDSSGDAGGALVRTRDAAESGDSDCCRTGLERSLRLAVYGPEV
jgi:hypothetical protein